MFTTERLQAMIADEGTKTIVFTEGAREQVEKMINHTKAVGRYFGESSEEYLKQTASLLQAFSSILMAGFAPASQVRRDGDLSLYVDEGGSFVFGVVFHRNRRYDNSADSNLPQPGEWSMHS